MYKVSLSVYCFKISLDALKLFLKLFFVYNGEHCGHWCTLGVGSVVCDSITELVWIFLLKFGLCS